MLERMKDIRYSEIKNWKPIVSIRESYRRESAIFGFATVCGVVVVCFLGYMAYLFVGGNTVPESTAGADSQQIETPPSINSSNSTGEKQKPLEDNASAEPWKNRFGNLDQAGTQGDTVVTVSSKKPQLSEADYSRATVRIGVLEVRRLFAADLKRYVDDRAYAMEQELKKHKLDFQNNPECSKEGTFLFGKLFQLQKEMAKHRLESDINSYLDDRLKDIRRQVQQVATSKQLDIVVRSDKVVDFNIYTDITDDVAEAVRRANLGHSAYGRSNVPASFNTRR